MDWKNVCKEAKKLVGSMVKIDGKHFTMLLAIGEKASDLARHAMTGHAKPKQARSELLDYMDGLAFEAGLFDPNWSRLIAAYHSHRMLSSVQGTDKLGSYSWTHILSTMVCRKDDEKEEWSLKEGAAEWLAGVLQEKMNVRSLKEKADAFHENLKAKENAAVREAADRARAEAQEKIERAETARKAQEIADQEAQRVVNEARQADESKRLELNRAVALAEEQAQKAKDDADKAAKEAANAVQANKDLETKVERIQKQEKKKTTAPAQKDRTEETKQETIGALSVGAPQDVAEKIFDNIVGRDDKDQIILTLLGLLGNVDARYRTAMIALRNELIRQSA